MQQLQHDGNEPPTKGGGRQHLWRGALADPDLRSRLAEPWLRWGQSLAAIGRRLRQPPRTGAPELVSWPVIALALLACAATLLLLRFDEEVSLAMLDEPAGVIAFLTYATDVGLVRWYVYPAFALVALLSVMDWSATSRVERLHVANVYGHAAYLFASVGLAGLITRALKIIFGRARPALLDEHGSVAFELVRFSHEFSSFPSGHSTTMGAVTVVLMIWFPMLRTPLLAAGIAFALTRVAVRAHYPSDVVAGLSIGMITALLLARWLAQRQLLYAFTHGGRGWRGLVPVRPDRMRDIDRQGFRTIRRRLKPTLRVAVPGRRSRARGRP